MRLEMVEFLSDLRHRRVYEWCLLHAVRPNGRGTSDPYIGAVRHERKKMTNTRLAQMMGVSRQYVTAAVGHLMEMGLLSRSDEGLAVVNHQQLWMGTTIPRWTEGRVEWSRFDSDNQELSVDGGESDNQQLSVRQPTVVTVTTNSCQSDNQQLSPMGGTIQQQTEKKTEADSKHGSSADADDAAGECKHSLFAAAAPEEPKEDELDEVDEITEGDEFDDDDMARIFGQSKSTRNRGGVAEQSEDTTEETFHPAAPSDEVISWDQPSRYSAAELGVRTNPNDISDLDDRVTRICDASGMSVTAAKRLASVHSLHEVITAVQKFRRKRHVVNPPALLTRILQEG